LLLLSADERERGLQTRHADGEARRGNLLAREARDEIVIAPAAPDRPEADGPALIVLRFDQQLSFEDRAGVVFEATDDRRVDTDTIRAVASGRNLVLDLRQLVDTGAQGRRLRIFKSKLSE